MYRYEVMLKNKVLLDSFDGVMIILMLIVFACLGGMVLKHVGDIEYIPKYTKHILVSTSIGLIVAWIAKIVFICLFI